MGWRCRYSNIDRIYQLPRPQPPGALVIIHLENAIRRGQTYYEWIAFFFDTNAYVDDLPLNTSPEVCARHLSAAAAQSLSPADPQPLKQSIRPWDRADRL